MAEQSPIGYEQHEATALLTVDDGKANAFGFELIECLNENLERASEEARVVAIIGRPGVLSGGFDLNVIRGGDASEINRLVVAGGRLMMRLYGHPQPLIVGATGHSVALGALSLLSADYRIGSDGDFKIGLNETAIGLNLPEFGIALASERISKRKLAQATLGANLYSPQAAIDIGYLDEVVAPDELRDACLAHAAKMAALDSDAYAKTKATLRGATIERVLAGLA